MNLEKQNGQETQEAPPPPLPRWDEEPEQQRSYWWVWLLVIGVLAVSGFLFRAQLLSAYKTVFNRGAAGAPPGGRHPPVVVATAVKGNMPIYLNGLGTVTPLNVDTVRTRVDGQIMKIYFTEGQMVKEGDPLVLIDPRPYQVMLEQAEGQMAKDTAALKDAQLDLARYKDLVASKSISQQIEDTQEALVHQDQGAIKIDQAAINNANLQLTYCNITAPISGRVGLRLVDVGNIVHATDTTGLVVVAQVQPITVVFTLPEDEIPQVLKKMATGKPVEVDAYDRDLTTKIASGTLLAIDNQIDPGSGTLRFKALFPNADLSLFPNQFVNARLLVDTLHGVVIVPTAAVQRSPTSTFIYIVDMPEKTVQPTDVTVLATEGNFSAIGPSTTPGSVPVKAGDVVVTDGVDKLVPGARVSLGKSTTRPTTGPAGGGAPYAGQGAATGAGAGVGPGVGAGPGHPPATTGAGVSAGNPTSNPTPKETSNQAK